VSLLAAGMAGQAADILAQIGYVPTWGDQVWDSSAILAQNSLVGRALHALIGYADRPSGVQIAVYLVTLVTLITLSRLLGRAKPKAPQGKAGSVARPAVQSR